MTSLPTSGTLNWGIPLNEYITSLSTSLSTSISDLASHEANNPSDPHGDRAYANALVLPLITNTNEPDGYAVCDSTGRLPKWIMPTGSGFNNYWDVKQNFGASGIGPTTDANAINEALAAAGAAGGGLVWVPPGNYGIDQTLVIYSNTTLQLSPQATFTRIGPVQSPRTMLCNFTSGTPAATSNIIVKGGTWNAQPTGQNSTCDIFVFANCDGITIEDVTLNGVADGYSHFGMFFGCRNVLIDNVTQTGAAPTGGRSSQHVPCWRIDECNSTNIPGLYSTDYTPLNRCDHIEIRSCQLNALTASDSYGQYTAWYCFLGDTSNITSGYHTYISCHDNCSNGHTYGIYGYNWDHVKYYGNTFHYPRWTYGWLNCFDDWYVDGNSPGRFIGNCGSWSDSTSEYILLQYEIPANDWVLGTNYAHLAAGLLSWTDNPAITFRLYLGSLGTTGDTQLGSAISTTLENNETNIPFSVDGSVYVATDGLWKLSQWSLVVDDTKLIGKANGTWSASTGSTFITITVQWSTASSSNIITADTGNCVRTCT